MKAYARLRPYLAPIVVVAALLAVALVFSATRPVYPDYSVSGSVRLTDGRDPEVQRLTDGEGGLAQVAIVKARWKAEEAIDDGGGYLLAVERLPRKPNGACWIELAMDGPRGALGWGEAGEQAEAKLGVALTPVGTWVAAPATGEATLVLDARRGVPEPDRWRAWLIQLDHRDNADDLIAVKEVDLT